MMLLRCTAATLALVAVSPASAATLIGEAMDVSYRFPTVDELYPTAEANPASFVVGAGVESIVNVEGVTDIVVDFAANTLVITFNTTLLNPMWNSFPFNGVLFEGAGAAKITGASVVSSTMAGFDDSRFYLANGDFGLNWQGLNYTTGTQIVANLTLADGPTEVPEPATWAMLLAGFGAIGSLARRRRTSVAYA